MYPAQSASSLSLPDLFPLHTNPCIALTRSQIASVLADGIMQNLFAERRHFREYKAEVTPDFSDVRPRANSARHLAARHVIAHANSTRRGHTAHGTLLLC